MKLVNLKKVVRDSNKLVMTVLGTFIILLCAYVVVTPLYKEYMNRDIKLSILATSDKGMEALANNVRVTHIVVNGKDIDLSKVKLDSNSQWKYDSKNDFLYAYNLINKAILQIPIKDVHNLSIKLVMERGSGIVNLAIDNKIWKRINLYKDVTWEETEISTNINSFVFMQDNIKVVIILFIILIVIWWLIFKSGVFISKEENILEISKYIIIVWLLSCLSIFFALMIQYRDINKVIHYMNIQTMLMFKCIILCFMIMMSLLIITSRLWISYIITSIFFILPVVISNIKLLNRGVPLLPWDVRLASEAISVAKGYDLGVGFVEIICLIFGVAITIGLVVYQKRKKKLKFIFRLLALPLIATVVIFIDTSFIKTDVEDNNTDYRVFRIEDYYNQRGFIPAFFEYSNYMYGAEKPVGYSRTNIEKIENNILNDYIYTNTKINSIKRKPTIIGIMDESYWNQERLDTVEFLEKLMPNFEQLKSESIYGELFTHVVNGGTVTSEFEFLTGFSGEFFPQDYMVYGEFLKNDFPSVVRMMKSQNYITTGIHPYVSTNYNRKNAYEKLGFDKSIFDKDFIKPKIVREYISDQTSFDRIIEEYKLNKHLNRPQFIFTVTMQNHGGYWEEKINKETTVNFKTNKYGIVAQNCMEDYFAGIHETDKALKKLIDYFRNVDEDVIIVFFGDHMTDAGPKDDRMFSKTSWNKNELMYDYEIHKVPFLVWNNFEQVSKDWGIMGISYLLPSIFKEYDIQETDFWKFLNKLNSVYSATDNYIFIEKDGNYSSISNMTKEQKDLREAYKLLQYDCIWGKNYAKKLWRLNIQ